MVPDAVLSYRVLNVLLRLEVAVLLLLSFFLYSPELSDLPPFEGTAVMLRVWFFLLNTYLYHYKSA